MFIQALLHGVVWGIWKKRNKRILEDKNMEPWDVIDSILCEMGSWKLVKKKFENFSLNDFLKDWNVCISPSLRPTPYRPNAWVPPLVGKVKVNFYGTPFGNPGLTAYGCLERFAMHHYPCQGEPIGIVDALYVEMMGLLEALHILKKKEFLECSVEGDSRTVISWGGRRRQKGHGGCII